MCHKWMVLTGHSCEPQMMYILKTAPTWCLAIVAENPGPHARAVFYVTPTLQNYFKISHFITNDLFFLKNIAFLHAIQCGAQVIYDADCDHVVDLIAAEVGRRQSWKDELHRSNWTWAAANGAMNLYPALLGRQLWPRGFPPQLVHDHLPSAIQYDRMNETGVDVDVIQLVPAECADVTSNATLRSAFVPSTQARYLAAVPGKGMAPFNSRSTIFLKAAFWALLLPASVPPCVSDIWRAFIAQRAMRQTSQAVGFAGPWPSEKQPCVPSTACPSELFRDSQKLINVLLRSSSLNATSVEHLLRQLGSLLEQYQLLKSADIQLIHAWEADLKQIGYKFPTLSSPPPLDHWPDLKMFLPLQASRSTMFKKIFLDSMVRFWPPTFARLTIITDAEETAFQDTLRVFLGRLRSDMRQAVEVVPNGVLPLYRRGHDRQQLIMFFADHYCDAEFIGFVDTDCLFITPVVLSDLFVDGKPVVIGMIGKPTGAGKFFWKQTPNGTHRFLRKPEVVRGMNYFPVVIHRSHLRELRSYVEELHKKSFGDVFRRFTKWPYSQFNVMLTYLWYFHREEYTWHLEDRRPGEPPHTVTNFAAVGLKPEHLKPKARVALHYRYHKKPPGGAAALMLEGSCRAGWMPAEKCQAYDMSAIHRDLFIFEGHAWYDVAKCEAANTEHYAAVRTSPFSMPIHEV
eukprot:GGOE01017897.1.p1 GENE.GGOE01017897.1~~GGOE01017897.1.p1  ORF type:complete len:726 (-),score=70.25 GGOE01017897.1:117-2168(-)